MRAPHALGATLAACLAQLCVAQIDPLSMLVPAWQTGSEEEPTIFTEWKGSFHDGSGPLGTYTNNQESWVLVNPCEAETALGKPCKVLLWFDLFETEPIYDTLTVYDGANTDLEIALLSGGEAEITLRDTLIRSSQPQILIHFHSDSYRSFQGWTAHYKTDQDATLSFLTSATQLLPHFIPPADTQPTLEYFGVVEHETTNTSIRVVLNDEHPYDPWFVSHPAWDAGYTISKQKVALNGQLIDSNQTNLVLLESGVLNQFTFTVTAMNLVTILDYVIEINRPADVNAYLKELIFSNGELIDRYTGAVGFAREAYEYSVDIIFEVETVIVTAVAIDPDVGSIWVGVRGSDGQYVATGSESLPVALINGNENAVDVVVTAEDGVHTRTYTNYMTRPKYSRSQFERQFLAGEWRRNQYGDTMLLTMGSRFDPCFQSNSQLMDGWVGPLTADDVEECLENGFELLSKDYDGSHHEIRGWYEVNPYVTPVMYNLDIMEATGRYSGLQGSRMQGWYRLTDWSTPATDGLSTGTRTHVNIELDLAWCTSQADDPNATLITTVTVETGEELTAPESVGPFGHIPWSCPMFSPILGNDTSRLYIQMRRDVDECLDGTHECSTDAICTNTYGSRWCACRSGYEGNPYFAKCVDIDECSRGTHTCGVHTYCINTPGAFNCSCNHGHEGNPSVYTFDLDITPDGSIDVMKKPGTEWECVSVHENHTCQHVPTIYPQRDMSVRGGRKDAYMDPSRGPQRLGANDQEQLWHFDDPPNAEYPYDSQHYYREKTDPEYIRALTESVPYPPPRWHFDGTPAGDDECSDIDECSTESHGCGDNSYCFNVPGSFSCHCHIGYNGNPYSKQLLQEERGCLDVNECSEGTHSCSDNSKCINIDGSFLCECPSAEQNFGQLFWHDRVPGKPYNSKCHMPLRQSRAFVTWERWTGEQINTLNGADAKCHSEGPELQPGFRWKAVLSDQGTSARHHLTSGETNILFPVIRTDGELVAVDADQLWSGMRLAEGTVRGAKEYFGLSNPIDVGPDGQQIPYEDEWTGAHEVWTGSDIHGERYEHGNCWSWREQTAFAQNQEGGDGPSSDGDVGHLGGSIYSGNPAGTPAANSPVYAGDVWNYDGPVDSTISYSKPQTHLPAGAGGSYGDLRSTLNQWHSNRDTLRECENKRRRLFCIEVHYSTRSVLRDVAISPFGGHLNSTWFSGSASTVVSPNDVYPVHALDGNTNTFWQSSLWDSDVWYQVDMRAHFTITAVLVQWHGSCFPSAYALMLSNSPTDHPTPPTSKFAGWEDPSMMSDTTSVSIDEDWRIYHEVISRTYRGGHDRTEIPSLFARSNASRILVKDPGYAVTAISPPEVARHVRLMVTDPNDMLCHALEEVVMYSPEERPFGSYSESARRAHFRGLQGDRVEQSHGGTFLRSSNPSASKSSVDGGRSYNDRDAWPTPSDGSVSYTSGTHRHVFEQPAGFPQVTSHAPPGWEFLQLRARKRATDRQRETRFDNLRHRRTQADSRLNPEQSDHPQYPCPPGVMSCDSEEPSSQEGHWRESSSTPNMPTPVNYARQDAWAAGSRSAGIPVQRRQLGQDPLPVVGCSGQEGCESEANATQGTSRAGDHANRYQQRIVVGGPSEGYRPRGSQDGDEPPSTGSHDVPIDGDVNESPLRQHNQFRGTVDEYDLRADTTELQEVPPYPNQGSEGQPMHDQQRKASAPELDGPQWMPLGPVGQLEQTSETI